MLRRRLFRTAPSGPDQEAPLVYPADLAARAQVERMEELCELFGAHPLQGLPHPGEWWVYLLLRTDRFCVYVGQSDNLVLRMRDHRYDLRTHYGAEAADMLLIGCRDDYQATVRELLLIDELQPPYNSIGIAARRRQVRSMTSPGKWVSRKQPDPYAPVPGIHDLPAPARDTPPARLDPGQATG